MIAETKINASQSVAADHSRPIKLSLVLEAWLLLLRFDLIKQFRSSQFLRTSVKREPVRLRSDSAAVAVEDLVRAMNIACVFYFKRVLCLQQSSATTVQLRRYGWPAQLVTGAQTFLCDFHAWAEVNGAVVNDKPYMREIYRVWEVY